MGLLTPKIEAFIGLESDEEVACDLVERGAVRRYVQAIMDDDLLYHCSDLEDRYCAPIAPPLFPMYMFRRDFGTPDSIQENASNPDFDGIAGSTAQGLPPLPLNLTLLNAGTDVEFFRYARHGDAVKARSSYDRIYEKQGSKGAMLIVTIKTEYRTADGELLMIVHKTQIRR